MDRYQKSLDNLRKQARYRNLVLPQGIDLTSNDYLGFRAHPELRAAALAAIELGIGMGAGGSRLLRGNMPEHESLETFAARYFGSEKALFFASGFQANTALFSTLCARQDIILFDELIHASARDGIQASPARHVRIPHNDLDGFETALLKAKADLRPEGRIWIAAESVYSMDGDLAPLADLQKLAQRHDAYLIVDEAHGTGMFGARGKGLSEDLLLSSRASVSERADTHDTGLLRGDAARNDEKYPPNLITLHTCGKALGVSGGLICASKNIIDYLINCARPFIYSTAPPPLQAVLVERALKLVQEEPARRTRLFALRDYANKVLPVPASPSQIVPIVLGSDQAALETARILQQAGYDIRAIRPPTVPENTARLRLSLSVNLSETILDGFASALVPHIERKAA